ncbi:MAG TPA: 4Fe-4S dicluster domain-containing protein [Rubrivivax sp.]|nr:4Fe-4S dicluster domain-containing protein [Rubrivivax sp.]HRY86637.1 4Fe-4S dicluster domain-containing protein [Rubrivivax sp.]HRZ60686.1 4Fe-4S dicluster domain-containing protein [Rubrivivax sp.]
MDAPTNPSARPYRSDFLREVEREVEGGEMVKMCMQCGVCAGSCPFGAHWEHSPQKLFMMIRAGKRDEVLGTDSMWMCTSCYNCVVRCPRKLPITTIMHGLASYAQRLGLAPKMQPTRDFSLAFYDNFRRTGRVNELKLTLWVYFRGGLVDGVKKAWSMRRVGLGMLKAGRLNPLEIFGGHEVQDRKGFEAMLAKAAQIEQRKAAQPKN